MTITSIITPATTFFLKRVIKYYSFVLSVFEKIAVKKFEQQEITHNPVFIIGAPRTGSTILYQILTQYLNINYVNNFVAFGYRSFYLNFRISSLFFRNKSHNSFQSKYGNTSSSGLNAPNEAGMFWRKWTTKGYDYVSTLDAENIDSTSLKNTICAVTNSSLKPLIFKNLNLGMKIALAIKIFPNSKFIFIKRDPIYTVQSIILARKKFQIEEHEWWSIKPPEYEKYKALNEVEMVVKQVFEIEKQISSDLKKLNADNYLIVNYESISIPKIINDAEILIGNVSKRKVDSVTNEVSFRNNKRLDDICFQKIVAEVKKYNWSNYSIKPTQLDDK